MFPTYLQIAKRKCIYIKACTHIIYTYIYTYIYSFSGSSDSKESLCNAGDPGLIPGLGRSPGKGNGYPFQYSCLQNSIDRASWQASVHGVTKSQTRLSNFHI